MASPKRIIPVSLRLASSLVCVLDALPILYFSYLALRFSPSILDVSMGLAYAITMFGIFLGLSISVFNHLRGSPLSKRTTAVFNAGAVIHAFLGFMSLPMYLLKASPHLTKFTNFGTFVVCFGFANIFALLVFLALKRNTLNESLALQ